MTMITIDVGGRSHQVSCRPGGEAHLRGLATIVDAKTHEARAAVGNVNETRQLLFAALLLADELTEPGDRADDAALTPMLARLAERVEAIADALETTAETP